VQALFDRRSPIGLLGMHINTKTGRWFESVSGIGNKSDSFYEYLLKSFLLYRRGKKFRMFTDTFAAIQRFAEYLQFHHQNKFSVGHPSWPVHLFNEDLI